LTVDCIIALAICMPGKFDRAGPPCFILD